MNYQNELIQVASWILDKTIFSIARTLLVDSIDIDYYSATQKVRSTSHLKRKTTVSFSSYIACSN